MKDMSLYRSYQVSPAKIMYSHSAWIVSSNDHEYHVYVVSTVHWDIMHTHRRAIVDEEPTGFHNGKHFHSVCRLAADLS